MAPYRHDRRADEQLGRTGRRVLLADEVSEALDRAARTFAELGHEVVGRCISFSDVVEEAERQEPDVAVVVFHEEQKHALHLVEEINDTASCPVVLLLDHEDLGFIREAADRGITAFASVDRPQHIDAAIVVAIRRFEDLERLGRQVRDLEAGAERSGAIERAKGILMERHDIDGTTAYDLLRSHARRNRMRLMEVARMVEQARALLPDRSSGDRPDETASA